ncbi:glycerol-3-phosphate O-acyltransferase [Pisolithus orientalis]|uniref:glycerol-3-phosphate O-acyltransferase n=1 Tax=Pisolithus orientalis TaxID=936130 RepID=UPI002224BBB8|nr:glycerol-3-phosphate O-acyltransferase [Pisolithus orientalis]KAI6028371.1 glycerol-3-phosphate O-acyltransferase [Pisolithus orientalis]
MAAVTYETALMFWRIITQIFFREIRPRGAFNIPRDGPVIFAGAPHSNQFLDPLLLSLEVYKETRRRVHFLTAAKSMKRKAVGFFARQMDSIPVARAVDEAKPGTGLGTQFKSEFSPKMQIMLPKSVNSAVAEVLMKEFASEAGKGTARVREKSAEIEAEGKRGFPFKILPFIDQQEMYRGVYQRLKDGGCIGIFPEGGSHDRTDLLPLKAGVSLMALGAMANDPSVKVKIVPVGLYYFHAHRFRSRAVVEFGSALDVPEELVEMFKQGGSSKRDAVAKLLDLIYDGLKTVTIRAPDYDTLMLIQAARRLYKTPGQHPTLGQVVELNRRFLEGYTNFKDEPRIQKLKTDVLKYNRLLRDLGLRDHQVPRAKKASWKTLSLLMYRLLLLLIWAVLALPGTILNGPVIIPASVISRRKAKEALAASVVKVAGRDVLATWKILICLGVAPLLYTFYAILATAIAVRMQVPLGVRLCTPFLVICALPFMNYAALKFGEAGMDVLKSLRPLILALGPGHQRDLDKVKEMRMRLSNEVVDVINEFGPKLYDDFDQGKFRILVPASAPPSTGNPGVWRRKSSVGQVDAQGNLLIHPMTWIDERLFGWSRTGTSVSGGSTPVSRPQTPDESEEEDHGDYDHVINYIPAYEDASRGKLRNRQGSYADLQRLRMTSANQTNTPVTASGAQTSDSQSMHVRSRKRKESLSDLVPVERIANVDRQEDFERVTKGLNKEISEKSGA